MLISEFLYFIMWKGRKGKKARNEMSGTQLEAENQIGKNYKVGSRLRWYLLMPIWNAKFHEHKPQQIHGFVSVKATVNFSA